MTTQNDKKQNGRNFGIELEFDPGNQNCNQVAEIFHDNGFTNLRNVNGYQQSNGNSWELKTDCSCGLELVSRKLKTDDSGLEELRTFTTLASNLRDAYNWKIDKKCGFHVHFEISDLNSLQIRNLVKLYLAYEPVIFAMQPMSRSRSGYCKGIRNKAGVNKFAKLAPVEIDSLFSESFSLINQDKFYGLNLKNYYHRKTIEIRYGAGTMNPEKIKAWVLFNLALIEKAKNSEFVVPFIERNTSLESLFKQSLKCFREIKKTGLKKGLTDAKKTLRNRFETFKQNHEQHTSYKISA